MNMTRVMWQATMWISLLLALCAFVLAFAASWDKTFLFMSLLLGQTGLGFLFVAVVAAIKDASS
jgi:hypothetical protein